MGPLGLPASFAQQRLWFLDQLEPGTAAYNLVRAFRITGPLDISALAAAFRAVIERQPVSVDLLPVVRHLFPSYGRGEEVQA